MQSIAWITGANGLIGNYLVQSAPLLAPDWSARGLARHELDLLDFASLQRSFRNHAPRLVFHCAALTNTPACEADPVLARKLNVDVTAAIAELAADIPLVFFSTDMVFDGRSGHYDESAIPNPLGVYGTTKLAAERIVLANPRHTVIRTTLNGGTSPTGNRGFNEQLRLAWQRGETPRLFVDEFRCPIPAIVTARAAWELAIGNHAGLYHVAGAEKLSRHELGRLIAARWPGLNPAIEAGSLKDYRGAPRPGDTSMNCAKAQRLLSFPLPGLSEWLAARPDEEF